MKLTEMQLRKIIEEELSMTQSPKRMPKGFGFMKRKGGGRASLGFGIPEESPGYGDKSGVSKLRAERDSIIAALEEVDDYLFDDMKHTGAAKAMEIVDQVINKLENYKAALNKEFLNRQRYK